MSEGDVAGASTLEERKPTERPSASGTRWDYILMPASDHNSLDDWLTALEALGGQPKRSGSGYVARCPAHDDRSPSLSVSEGGSGVLAHCFAGCAFDDILAAVRPHLPSASAAAAGVPVRKQRPRKPPARRKKLPDGPSWLYHDAGGAVVLAVVRHAREGGKKSFTQWSPIPRDAEGNVWEATGMPSHRPLYRLPALGASEGRIALVEGEKCAEAAQKAFPTSTVTTWAGGTEAWSRTDWRPLAGREVTLVADGDEPGQSAMQDIAALLHAQGSDVTLVLGDRDKSDVADWIEALGPAGAAEHIKAHARPFTPPAALTFARPGDGEAKPVRWLWRNWIPMERVSLLTAPGGTGKGSVALEVAAAAAGWLETFPDGSPSYPVGHAVLYVSFEDELATTIRPRLQALGAGGCDAILVAGDREVVAATARAGGSDPLAVLREMRAAAGLEVSLIVIDPLVELLGTLGLNENSNAEMAQVMGQVRRFAEEWRCAVLLVHHTRKDSASGGASDASRGASAITNAARTQLRLLNGTPDDPDARSLGRAKANLATTRGIIRYRVQTHDFYNADGELIETAILERDGYDVESSVALELARGADGQKVDEPQRRRDELMQYIAKNGPVTTADLYLVFGDVTERMMGSALKRLAEEGRITSTVLSKSEARDRSIAYVPGTKLHTIASEADF